MEVDPFRGVIPPSIQEYLQEHHVSYHVLHHEPRGTSQETAQVVHVSGKRFAKTVLLRTHDGLNGGARGFVLAVLPASEKVDLAQLGAALGYGVDLATEEDFVRLFPGTERGAAPPFGELAAVPVVADPCLASDGAIVFHGGTHTDLIEMPWRAFVELTEPRIIDYGEPVA